MDPNQWTDASQRAYLAAQSEAREQSHAAVAPAHLAVALFGAGDAGEIGRRVCATVGGGVRADQVSRTLAQRLYAKLSKQSPAPESPQAGRPLVRVLNAADAARKKAGDSFVAVDHLLAALAEDAGVGAALGSAGLEPARLVEALRKIRGSRKADTRSAETSFDALAKYSEDLTALAEAGRLDPVIGRDDEIRRMVQVLQRRSKNNPVLTGPPGVGKTALAEGLARRIVDGDVPESLRKARIYSLSVAGLLAGASHRGEFEERLQSVIREVREAPPGSVVVFVDEAHLLMGAGGGGGAVDASNILKPALARGELRLIAATTDEEYQQHVEKDAAFERRFQRIQVSEPSTENTVSILRGLKDRYEAHHGVTITDSALVLAARLARRYITSRRLPDSAIDLLDEACAAARVTLDSRPEAIDRLERQKLRLMVEVAALEREKDDESKARLRAARKELAAVEEELRPLLMQHEAERARADEVQHYKQRLDEVKVKLERARRAMDYEVMSDLQYNAIPIMEEKIADAERRAAEEAARAAAAGEERLSSEVVDQQQIAEVVARATGVPVERLSATDRERVLGLAERLHRSVIGQDAAVKAVSEALLRARAGMGRPGAPMGAFLFLGPTGTGKTELAKALAAEMFDDRSKIVRFDMSEYMERHAVARLIGAPPGYVGYEQGGALTEAVRREPYSILLFDEVEKAHVDAVSVLLQMLDDGRITDGKGRVADASNTIVILTSNLGSQHVLDGAAAGSAAAEAAGAARAMEAVRGHFRPEFLNRLDDVIVFHPLSRDNLRGVVRLMVEDVGRRLREQRGVSLRADDAACELLIDDAYDPAYGARPLRRRIEHGVVTDLSRMLVSGAVKPRSLVTITVGADGRLDYRVEARAADRDDGGDDTPMQDASGSGGGSSPKRQRRT